MFDRLIKILPPNTVNKECIELAVKLGDISQPLPSRIVSANIIGSLAPVVEKKEFMTKLIPKLKRLCADFNWEGRKAMCLNLEKVSSVLSTDECD